MSSYSALSFEEYSFFIRFLCFINKRTQEERSCEKWILLRTVRLRGTHMGNNRVLRILTDEGYRCETKSLGSVLLGVHLFEEILDK